ncbi:PVC-type heme-binding CxxCH protein [Thalassoglobus sp.]|uniref:PVC-type heme-binding CxxCH protein n=1 Tax=Thalassoglobus sp. TaxID=2795869 RepID=UPI003AA9C680
MLLNVRVSLLLVSLIAISTSCALGQENKNAEFGPFSAEEAAKKFVLHADCKIELVAAEPDVIDPVHIAFNTDGKLWVVEMTDYPNGPGDGQPGLSRIRVLSDDDGDGRFNNPVTFAEKLLFANGLMFWKDGVIVTTDGKIQFMRDTNGDGKADETQVWFEGFATENPQLRHNHPQLAMDCKIYIANGLRGGNIVPGPDNPWGLDPKAKPLSISGRDFRFDPLTGKYEAIAGMAQFGMAFDAHGNRFVCTNRNPGRQIVLEDEQLKLTPGLRIPRFYEDVAAAGEDSKLYPLSRTWTTSNLHANQFTAACGALIYNDSSLGDNFFGNIFTCDPTANLVHREIPVSIGPTSRSHSETEGVEFLATKDEWFRPVNLAHGPDKALYVVDMYRAVIEHPQFMPVELKDRPDLTLGLDKGRIWRVVRSQPPAASDHKLEVVDSSSPDQLIEALSSNSVWKQNHAQRLLIESDSKEIVPQLRNRINTPKTSDEKHLLPLIATLDKLTMADLEAAMSNANDIYFLKSFFELGQRHFGETPEWKELVNSSFQRTDSGIPVSSFIFEMLGQVPWKTLSEADQKIVLDQILKQIVPGTQKDSEQYDPYWLSVYLRLAARSESLDVSTQLIAAFEKFNPKNEAEKQALRLQTYAAVRDLAELVAKQNQKDQARTLLATIVGNENNSFTTRMSVLSGLVQGFPGGRTALNSLIASLPDKAKENIAATMTEATRELKTKDSIAEELPILFDLLSLADDDASLQQLITATGSGDATRASLALSALLKRPAAQVNPALVELLPKRRGSVRRSILQAMASNTSRAPALLDEIESGRVPALEIDATVEKTLYRLSDKELVARAQKLLKREPPADRVKVLAEYQVSLTMDSDPLRGKVTFEKNCATCHKVGDVGVNVAPDISDSRTKTPDFYLMNILDPNRAIDANYFSFNILDTDGKVHSGIVASETSTSVTLKQPEGKLVTIDRENIEEFKNTGVSLMPVGLERKMSKQEVADVISFIKNWRYLDGQIPKEVIK